MRISEEIKAMAFPPYQSAEYAQGFIDCRRKAAAIAEAHDAPTGPEPLPPGVAAVRKYRCSDGVEFDTVEEAARHVETAALVGWLCCEAGSDMTVSRAREIVENLLAEWDVKRK